jgi:chaperonin GroEL (HSP60 family)
LLKASSSWKLHERLAKLSGAAVIRVGRATEIDVKEHKDRVDIASLTSRTEVADRSAAVR